MRMLPPPHYHHHDYVTGTPDSHHHTTLSPTIGTYKHRALPRLRDRRTPDRYVDAAVWYEFGVRCLRVHYLLTFASPDRYRLTGSRCKSFSRLPLSTILIRLHTLTYGDVLARTSYTTSVALRQLGLPLKTLPCVGRLLAIFADCARWSFVSFCTERGVRANRPAFGTTVPQHVRR